MKKIISYFLIIFTVGLLASCSKEKTNDARLSEVVVYTYDSFLGEWGAGNKIADGFEKASGSKVSFVNCGDGAQILSKAILEKNAPQADVLLGLDNNLVSKAMRENVLQKYEAKNVKTLVDKPIRETLGAYLTPYDFSHFALIYDTKSKLPAPKSLQDLKDALYEKKLILMDPRTSTPGLGFLAWVVAVFGDEYKNYFSEIKNSVLTLSPSWSTGYGLFTKGEAPLVISYVTSPFYHAYADNTDRYQALIFDEGHVEQVEGAGLVKNAPNKKGAELFLDYLITDEAQKELPLTQWMYPANKNVQLPECYGALPKIKTLMYDSARVEAAIDNAVSALGK